MPIDLLSLNQNAFIFFFPFSFSFLIQIQVCIFWLFFMLDSECVYLLYILKNFLFSASSPLCSDLRGRMVSAWQMVQKRCLRACWIGKPHTRPSCTACQDTEPLWLLIESKKNMFFCLFMLFLDRFLNFFLLKMALLWAAGAPLKTKERINCLVCTICFSRVEPALSFKVKIRNSVVYLPFK